MSKTDEILELKFDIPNWILRILGYKIRSHNEKCNAFQKNMYGKDNFNYAVIYEIHIFKDKVFKTNEICVTPHYLINDMYDWFSGKEALHFIKRLDKILSKFVVIKRR